MDSVDQIMQETGAQTATPDTQPSDPVDQILQETGAQQVPPKDVTNAQQKLGNTDTNGLCQAFVEQVTGSGYKGSSAVDAWDNYVHAGQARSGLTGAKPGDILYFSPNQSNEGYGHTGIYEGNGKFISATDNGVQSTDLATWEKETGQQILGHVPQQ